MEDSILDISAIKVYINKLKNNEKTVKPHPHQLPIVFFLNLPELNIIIITSLFDPLKYQSPLDKHPGKVRIISVQNNKEENDMGRPDGTKKNGIKYLSESELAAFMKAVRKNKRDHFLFSLALFVGARVSEICQLKLNDVNEGSFQIFIQGKKNGTSRHYTMSGKLWKKYQSWMRERAKMEHAALNPYLFITKYTMHDAPMTEQAVKNAFKKYAAAAALESSFSVHSLRHTCAVMRIAAGCHIVKVQKWLRHKSLTSTMVYADIASPEMKKDERDASQTFDKFL